MRKGEKAKYRTLKGLKAAIDAGDVPVRGRHGAELLIDNDYVEMSSCGCETCEAKEKTIYFYRDEPPEATFIEEALRLLGIPFQRA